MAAHSARMLSRVLGTVITSAAEQFGTNMRSTVTTLVPNLVRAAVIPITLSSRANRSLRCPRKRNDHWFNLLRRRRHLNSDDGRNIRKGPRFRRAVGIFVNRRAWPRNHVLSKSLETFFHGGKQTPRRHFKAEPWEVDMPKKLKQKAHVDAAKPEQ